LRPLTGAPGADYIRRLRTVSERTPNPGAGAGFAGSDAARGTAIASPFVPTHHTGDDMNPLLLVLVLATSMLAGCEAIAGIFQAGAWFGIVGAIVIIGIVALIFSVFRKR
jgi:hypothetical protein